MKYDVVIIGAGISGLTCASLLAKRNLKVCVVDAQYKPGGACGIFKREDTVFEQGSAMIYVDLMIKDIVLIHMFLMNYKSK